jgi:hypothetical protein
MFDAGAIPDASFERDGTPVTEGVVSATRQLTPQLAAIGYRPSDVTYFALSHYHADHTANALAGDLYHYPEQITTGRVPTFEWNADRSRASRARVAALMKETGAAMWIGHDIATHAKLPRAPKFVE